MVVKPAVIGCLVSCAVMWPRSPADLVDNGASGERSVMSRSAAVHHRSSLLSFTLI